MHRLPIKMSGELEEAIVLQWIHRLMMMMIIIMIMMMMMMMMIMMMMMVYDDV